MALPLTWSTASRMYYPFFSCIHLASSSVDASSTEHLSEPVIITDITTSVVDTNSAVGIRVEVDEYSAATTEAVVEDVAGPSPTVSLCK